jgi:hypothetical protein
MEVYSFTALAEYPVVAPLVVAAVRLPAAS